MSFRRTIVGGCLVGVAASLVGVGAAPPAQADCVYAELYVTREGDTPIWVVGEHDPCLTPTPWTWQVADSVDFTLTLTGHPDGAPNGYHRDIRVPLPPV